MFPVVPLAASPCRAKPQAAFFRASERSSHRSLTNPCTRTLYKGRTSMRRHHLFLGLIAAVSVSAFFVWRSSSGAPQPPDNGQGGERRAAQQLAARPDHSLQQRRRLLPARRRHRRRRPRGLAVPGQRRQRSAQKPRPARPRPRQGDNHQLRRPGTHRTHPQNFFARSDRQSDVRPDAQPGARREDRGDAAKRQRRRLQHADGHHRRHGIA